MAYEKTLVLLKHDAVARGIMGEIIQRFERIGLKICGMKLVEATDEMGQKHYPNSVEWLTTVGNRTLDEYKEKKIDPIKRLGTDDPIEIGKLIKQWNVEYLTTGPVLALVLEGPDAVKLVRKHVGSTIPAMALPGTIRGDYSFDNADIANDQGRPFYNLIHASGNVEEANYEIDLWFKKDEIFDQHEIAAHSAMGYHKKMEKKQK
jgi:nucleoside-diphosphate kinase